MSETKQDCHHPMHHLVLALNAGAIKKELMRIFKQTDFRHCPNCGALIPELKIDRGDRTFSFCCYEVSDYEIAREEHWEGLDEPVKVRSDTKRVIETDYTKFGNYLTRSQKH